MSDVFLPFRRLWEYEDGCGQQHATHVFVSSRHSSVNCRMLSTNVDGADSGGGCGDAAHSDCRAVRFCCWSGRRLRLGGEEGVASSRMR